MKYSIILFISVFILFFHLTYAQNTQDFWLEVEQNDLKVNGERQIIPERYLTLKLDEAAMRQLLDNAPMEFTPEVKNNPVIILLPKPNGTYERFSLMESPMVEQALLDQYPDLKTWSAQGMDTPGATAKIDFTHKGFHAMVLSAGGDWFIDPYHNKTTEYYISYYKKDLKNRIHSFECHTESQGLDQINQNKKKLQIKKDASFAGKGQAPNNIAARFGDCEFRTYRLALAATGEYTQFHGGTVASALAAQVTAMNRVNGIYERDFALRMNIIANNNLIIYTNASTDPYTNSSGSTMLGENQSNLTAVIGSANYDIGHVFSTGGGGIASLNSPCSANNKARGVTGLPSPIGDPFYIDYVAHEMGHQWGGNHTFNNCAGSGNNTSGVETGSGVTIQAYAGICGSTNVQSNSDAMFHAYSIQEMYSFITGNGNNCAVTSATANNFPDILTNTPSQAIPKSTPFMLTCTATDLDGDSLLTYSWEQMNAGSPASAPPVSSATSGPLFRTFLPTSEPTRYFPRLTDLVNNISPTWEVLPGVARTMNFRLIVRDNYAGAGCNDHVDIALTVDGNAGPFTVTYPSASGITLFGFAQETITWNVSGTDAGAVNCPDVDILLSLDGGLTYTDTIAIAVPNTGSYSALIPNTPTTTARIMVKGSGRAFFDISNNNFTINQGSAGLACFASANDASCNGSSDGSIFINTIGGVPPYTYLWNTGATTQDLLSVSAGTYTITVTDANTDDTSCVVTVGEPSAISAQVITTDILCEGDTNGSAALIVSGGVPLITAPLDTLVFEDFEDNNANGFTQVTQATDGGWLLGDAAALSSTSWSIPQGSVMAATNDDACDCNKSADYFILPAQDLTAYSSVTLNADMYFEGNTYQGNTEVATVVVSTNGTLWTPVDTIAGSTSWQNVSVNLDAYAGVSNLLVAFLYNDGSGWLYGWAVDNVLLTGVPASYSAYNYQWSNGQNDSLITGLTAGTYTVIITDGSGCSITETAVINTLAPITITTSKSNVNCNGSGDGAATVATGGANPPFTISWNTSPVQNTNMITNLQGGFYTVTVTDSTGCAKSSTVEVREPAPLLAFYVPTNPDTAGASTGSINLLVTGGINPYTYLWNTGAITEDLFNVPAGTYLVTTTDRNGCSILTMITLTDPSPFAPQPSQNRIISADEAVEVFPNPAADKLYIKWNQTSNGNENLEVFEISGKLLIKESLTGNANLLELNVKSLEKGIYLLRISGQNYTRTTKFIKN